MTNDHDRNPLLRPTSIFLVALSLSIGWGIRGNFGHEAGAMLAGVLSATAVAVLSRREDWHSRTAYLALLGGLGWGFGGSIAYMYPFAFTESGDTASTYYGYFAIFLEGGLWCGMGAAGTALAAVMPISRLTRFFMPLCFVLATMGLRHAIEGPLEELLAAGAAGTGDETWHRHESPLYWFDADWFPACLALIGVCAYDLFDRWRAPRARLIDHPLALLPFVGIGATLGHFAQRLLQANGWEETVGNAFVVKLGDLNYVNPESGNQFDPDQLLTNWPQFFGDYTGHLGWGIGLLVGAAVYFGITGRFRDDATLFLYLSLGWLFAFLALPVLGSTLLMDYGGCRVMPPRSDDWAGILGVFVGGLLWSRRHGLAPVSHVMSGGFILGGIAFATMPMLRYVIRYPGHPWRFPDGVPESLRHYQSANWHSIMEQMHGFGHGLAIALVMAMLWRRQPCNPSQERVRGWTVAFSVVFVLFGITYLNFFKLVGTWVEKGAIPATLKAPLWGAIEAPPLFWFAVVWCTAGLVCGVLLFVHLRRRLDVVPTSWVGKGQLIYILFLWIAVIGNLLRAIPGFGDGRMVTEWVLFMNACLATLLVVSLPRPACATSNWNQCPAWPSLLKTWIVGLSAAALLMSAYAFLTLSLYQEHVDGKPWANHRRFGAEAKWRTDPILKQGEHP